MDTQILVSIGGLTLLTIGVVQAIKTIIGLKKEAIPLVALIIGVVLALIASVTNLSPLSIGEAVFTGLAVGLSASGLYDQKKLFKKKE